MTREDAIFILHGIRADNLNLDDLYTKDKYEALGMAIKALEQQPCEDCISREAVLELAKKGILVSNGNYTSVCKAINELPSVTPKGVTITDFADRCRECGRIKPCEDCISRQAVINTIFYNSDNNCDVVLSTDLMDRIKHLPSVTPTSEAEDKYDIGYNCGYADAMCDIAGSEG